MKAPLLATKQQPNIITEIYREQIVEIKIELVLFVILCKIVIIINIYVIVLSIPNL